MLNKIKKFPTEDIIEETQVQTFPSHSQIRDVHSIGNSIKPPYVTQIF